MHAFSQKNLEISQFYMDFWRQVLELLKHASLHVDSSPRLPITFMIICGAYVASIPYFYSYTFYADVYKNTAS